MTDLFLGLLQSLLRNLSSVASVFLTSTFLTQSDFLPCLFTSTLPSAPSLLNLLCLAHSSAATSLPFPVETSSTFLAPANAQPTGEHELHQQSPKQVAELPSRYLVGSCKYISIFVSATL